ncbi:hypothetical protein [Nocardia fusca]|uniref:hypothetical protein n=1 Tax=Nocardia fusca TaxID=941183 RepID=UPI0007A73D1C|nr:hypothetical protein [Nocardia fusca]
MDVASALELRPWDACDSEVHRVVFGWGEHPAVPAHASRAMVAAMVFRCPGPTTAGGRRLLSVHNWIAYRADEPVAYLGADVIAAWAEPEDFRPATPQVEVPSPVMSISTLVDPARWGQGISVATKTAVTRHPEAAAVESFHTSIRADNARSVKAILKVPGIQYVGTGAEDGHLWRHYRWPR